MTIDESTRTFKRKSFTRRLDELCQFVDSNYLTLEIEWVDHENPAHWDSIDTVTITYINGHQHAVNCRINSIKATAKAVLDNL